MDQICMPSSPHSDSVVIVRGHVQWFVRVVENGCQHTDSYACEAAAERHAEGDRIRLRLNHVVRM